MTMTEETSLLAEASILPGGLTCSAHLSKNTDWSGRTLTDKPNLDPSWDQIIVDGSDWNHPPADWKQMFILNGTRTR